MATLASTNITTNINPNAEQPIAFGQAGLEIEFFRVALGGVADTIVLTPRWSGNIVAVQTGGLPASNNLTTSAANTNVTLTLLASGATNATADVQLICRQLT
jgi:hypothetical protein